MKLNYFESIPRALASVRPVTPLPICLSIGPDDLHTILNEIPKLQPNPSAQPANFRFGNKASWAQAGFQIGQRNLATIL